MAGALALTDAELAKLPAQVRAQYEQATNTADAGNDADAGVQTPAEALPTIPVNVEQPVAAPEVPVFTPEPVATPEPSVPGEFAQKLALLEQQYRTLQGMFNAQVPALQAGIRDRDAQITQLRTELEQARAIPVLPVGQPLTVDDLRKIGLTDDELDNGVEVFTGAQKLIAAEVARQVQAHVAKAVEPIQADRFTEYQQKRAAAIPDWTALNKSPAFHAFLDELEPISKQPYQDLAQRANDAMDLNALTAIVNAFRATQPKQNGNGVAAQVKPEPRGAAPQAGGKPKYTIQQWKTLMDNAARGIVNGQRATHQVLQTALKELEAARAEGRII